VTAKLTDQPAGKNVVSLFPDRRRSLFAMGIAATLLLLVGLFYTFQHDVFKTEKSRINSYDTQLAYNQASEALLIVSSNLNTGIKQVSRFQMVEKAMKNVQLFNKFYQYQTIIFNPDKFQNQSIKTK